MTIALIKDQVVQNLIAADDLSVASLFPDFIAIQVDHLEPLIQIGWQYIDGELVAPITE